MLGEGLDAAEAALRVLADVNLARFGPARRRKLSNGCAGLIDSTLDRQAVSAGAGSARRGPGTSAACHSLPAVCLC
jgi:hypothetical protein